MCEFIPRTNGTAMFNGREWQHWTSTRIIPTVTRLKGSQSHAQTARKTHLVLPDGKMGKEDPLVDVLRAKHIIHQVFAVRRFGASSVKCFLDASHANASRYMREDLAGYIRPF